MSGVDLADMLGFVKHHDSDISGGGDVNHIDEIPTQHLKLVLPAGPIDSADDEQRRELLRDSETSLAKVGLDIPRCMPRQRVDDALEGLVRVNDLTTACVIVLDEGEIGAGDNGQLIVLAVPDGILCKSDEYADRRRRLSESRGIEVKQDPGTLREIATIRVSDRVDNRNVLMPEKLLAGHEKGPSFLSLAEQDAEDLPVRD